MELPSVTQTGFGSWTVKAGVHHVQPPTDVLENMVAVRIHLDECREDNGPVRVIPGSHSKGLLTAVQIQSISCPHRARLVLSAKAECGGDVLCKVRWHRPPVLDDK